MLLAKLIGGSRVLPGGLPRGPPLLLLPTEFSEQVLQADPLKPVLDVPPRPDHEPQGQGEEEYGLRPGDRDAPFETEVVAGHPGHAAIQESALNFDAEG